MKQKHAHRKTCTSLAETECCLYVITNASGKETAITSCCTASVKMQTATSSSAERNATLKGMHQNQNDHSFFSFTYGAWMHCLQNWGLIFTIWDPPWWFNSSHTACTEGFLCIPGHRRCWNSLLCMLDRLKLQTLHWLQTFPQTAWHTLQWDVLRSYIVQSCC